MRTVNKRGEYHGDNTVPWMLDWVRIRVPWGYDKGIAMSDGYEAFRQAVEQYFPGGFTLRDERCNRYDGGFCLGRGINGSFGERQNGIYRFGKDS